MIGGRRGREGGSWVGGRCSPCCARKDSRSNPPHPKTLPGRVFPTHLGYPHPTTGTTRDVLGAAFPPTASPGTKGSAGDAGGGWAAGFIFSFFFFWRRGFYLLFSTPLRGSGSGKNSGSRRAAGAKSGCTAAKPLLVFSSYWSQ